MPELETKSLPESAYEPLKPGQSYPPIVASNVKLPELTPRSVGWGIFLCIIFTIAAAYSGLKVGQVMESAIPISILAIGLGAPLPAALQLAGERDHHRHRRSRRPGRGGSDLHPSGAVHPEAGSAPRADDLHLPGRRMSRRPLPDSVATLFRARHARHASLPGSHGHHRSSRHRREGRIAGQAAAAGDRDRRRLRLLCHDVSGLEGVRRFPISCPSSAPSPNAPAWPSASTPSASSSGLGYVMGLRSSMILCAGGVLSNLVLVPLIWFIGSHLDSAVYPGSDSHLEHDRSADLSQLCALYRRRRDRDRGHLRHCEVVADRGRFLRHRAARFPAEAKPLRRSAPIATSR